MVLITKENKTYNYPINLQPSGEEFTLEVYSHMSKTTTTFTGLTGVVVDDFVGIEMTDVMLSKLPNGEYDYTVYDNDQTRVSIGLLRVDLEQQGEEDEPEYVVYHDEMDGYITIQNQDEAYEQGFTDGYDSGFTDGVDSVPLTTTGFTQNGIFRPSEGGWNEVEVNVPTGITPSGELVISGNGIYDVVQYADVDVQVPVEDYYQSGYTSGYTTGYESGFTVGYESGYTDGEIVGYESGFTAGYSSGETDGFESGYQSGCTDGFNTGYQSGYTDGVDSVPLVATGFTSNGTFSATTGGFNVVTVNVPTGITPSGTITIDTNGTYDVTDKASANVQIPVEDYYQSGYTSGYTDGYQSGVTDGVESGYTSGYTDGYQSGVTDGFQSGYDSGFTDGVESGYTSGYQSGYTTGYDNGYSSGRTDGYNDGFDDGVDSGFTSGETYGFQVGYDSGFTDGVDSGYTSGYTSGYAEGYDNGYDDGFEDGEESVPLNSTGFTENGSYTASTGGWSAVTVNVPTGITPTGQFAISGNGTYDITQYASVDVNVPVQDYWQSGYTSGYTDGYQSGVTDGTQSGYTSGYTDGFQSGYTSGETDGFQSGYSSGFTDGVDSGFTSGYTSGYTDGVDSVPLSTTGITSNGTYTKESGGWNEVTVSVPSVTTQTMTQAQYDALIIKDPMVIYLING